MVQPYLSVEKTALLCQVLTGADVAYRFIAAPRLLVCGSLP